MDNGDGNKDRKSGEKDAVEMGLNIILWVLVFTLILAVGIPTLQKDITKTAQHVMGEQLESSVRNVEEVTSKEKEEKELIGKGKLGIKTYSEEEAIAEKELTKVIGIQGYKVTKDKIVLKTTKGNTEEVKLSDETIKAYYIADTRGISKEYKDKLKGVNYIMATKDKSNAKLLFKDYDDYQVYEADVEYAKINSKGR